MVTANVILNKHEHLVLQKKWLSFDLYSGRECVATYDCSQEETYALIALSVMTSRRPTPFDLLVKFVQKCKVSHNANENLWKMFLESNFSENIPSVFFIDAAINNILAEAKAKEKASKNLHCSVLVNGEHVT